LLFENTSNEAASPDDNGAALPISPANQGVFMPASHASIATASASRYLQQLCKHWSHKFAVEFTPEHGTIPFDETRRCVLDASAGRLALRIEAADDAALIRTQGVVIDHLKRFAFREDLGEVAWERDVATA
jgi:hypothetical protein